MDRRIICVALVLVVFSTALASCSLGGGSAAVKSSQVTFNSYSEKASYYDALVAGDNEPIPLTTALNSAITVEGDKDLLDEDVYNKLVDVANQTYLMIRNRYGSNGSQGVMIVLNPTTGDLPYSVAGTQILLSTEWFNNHPNECDTLIESFASILLRYEHEDRIPKWFFNAFKVYIRDEFALYGSESSFSLPKRYNGQSYETDSLSAAAFLKWIKETQGVDMMDRLNRQLRSINGYREEVWLSATGKTLDQLWTLYKKA